MDDKKSTVLSTKLIKLYGGTPSKDAYIKEQVDGFLMNMRNKKMSASDIQALERKVEAGAKKLEANEAAKSGPPNFKQVELNKEKSSKPATNDSELPLSYLVYKEASSLEHQREEIARRRRDEEKKLTLRRELDAQIQENQTKGDVQTKIEEDYSRVVSEDLRKFREENKTKAQLEAENLAKLAKEREIQLQQIEARRERERRREKAEDDAMLRAAREAVEAQEKRRREMIKQQEQFMRNVIAENEENKRIKAEVRRKEQAEEKRLQEEYARRLDDQERIRQETFERMKAKSSQNQQMYLQATAEKTAKDKEDEAKALAYQQEKVRRDMESLEQEKRNRLTEKERLRAALAEQVATKQRREAEEAAAKSEFVGLYRSEAQRAIEEARQEDRRRKQAAIQHRLDLLAQIEEKQSRENETDESVMTEAEKKLNKKDIEKLVSQDSSVVRTITIKLEQAAKVDAAKKRRALGIRGGPADLAEEDF